MAHLPYPDPAHVAEALQQFPVSLEIEPDRPMGHGVISMLQVEQAKRSAQLAAEITPGDYRVY